MARLLFAFLALFIASASCQFLTSPYSSSFLGSSLYGSSLSSNYGFPRPRGPLIVHKSTPYDEKYVIINNPDRFQISYGDSLPL